MEHNNFTHLQINIGDAISFLDLQGNTHYGTYADAYDPHTASFRFKDKNEEEKTVYLKEVQEIFRQPPTDIQK